MRACPNCGYQNPDSDTTCGWCSRALPPPAPIPLSRAASTTRTQKVLWFVLGVVLGLIPAAIYALGAAAYGLHGFYSNSFGAVAGPGWPTIGCYLLPVLFIITGIFLSVRRYRPLGYGLLAAAIISPVVVAVSCVAAPKV
jgi:hypothetical protein